MNARARFVVHHWEMLRTTIPLTAVLLWATEALAEPATYTLVPGKSHLVAQLFKAGAGSRFAHDHVVQARAVSGQVRVDPLKPGRSSIQVRVKTASLQADDPALRRKYGLKGALSPADRRKVEANMRSADQLNTARHRWITFTSSRVVPRGPGRFQVTGKLTIRGVGRVVTLDVRAAVSGQTFRGTGKLLIRQSAFGYKPYSAMLGLVKVRDVVTLRIQLHGQLSTTTPR